MGAASTAAPTSPSIPPETSSLWWSPTRALDPHTAIRTGGLRRGSDGDRSAWACAQSTWAGRGAADHRRRHRVANWGRSSAWPARSRPPRALLPTGDGPADSSWPSNPGCARWPLDSRINEGKPLIRAGEFDPKALAQLVRVGTICSDGPGHEARSGGVAGENSTRRVEARGNPTQRGHEIWIGCRISPIPQWRTNAGVIDRARGVAGRSSTRRVDSRRRRAGAPGAPPERPAASRPEACD